MKNQQTTSWGHVAPWYERLLQDEDTPQRQVILPHLLRLMELKKTDVVVDVACGSGFFTKAWVDAGAKQVIGTDIGEELIAFARKIAPDATFHVASADAMADVKKGKATKATMILALQNIENVAGVFSEVRRILTAKGRFYLVLNHPAFRIPKASGWEWDNEGYVQFRRVDAYLTESKHRIQMHPGDAPDVTTISFHRPLQYYFKALTKAGLCVLRMEEWTSHKMSDSGPRADAENVARKEIPLFLCLEIAPYDTMKS